MLEYSRLFSEVNSPRGRTALFLRSESNYLMVIMGSRKGAGRRSKELDPETVDKILRLRGEEWSEKAIAEEVGVSRRQIRKVVEEEIEARSVNRFERLDDCCPLLCSLNDGYFYCIGSKGWKRKLGVEGTFEEAVKMCDRCGLKDNYRELQKMLEERQGVEIEYLMCEKKGQVHAQDPNKVKCPLQGYQWVDLESCRTIEEGRICRYLGIKKTRIKPFRKGSP